MRDLNLLDLGWLFFTAWTVVIAVLSAKAFGQEVVQELIRTKK